MRRAIRARASEIGRERRIRARGDVEEDCLAMVKRSRPADEDLVAASRSRVAEPLTGRDRWASTTLGLLFLATAAIMVAFLPGRASVSVPVALLLIVGYAVVSRVEFEIGPGSAVPTQLLFVPMLFALPASAVPLCVACAYLLGAATDYASGRIHIQRAWVLLSSSWYSVGPALVFTFAGVQSPRWRDWPIYIIALAAQFTFDLCSSSARERFAFGTPIKSLLPFLAWVYAVDSLLAPLGLSAAFTTTQIEFAFLLTLPLIGLLALLARDRRARIDQALAFSSAYRGASREARKDPLTGLGNRLAWQEASTLADVRREVSGEPVSVIVLDLDRLKLANDTRGHQFGDDMLRAIAALVQANVRGRDVLARIGGDEFGVLMPDTDEEACAQTVIRLVAAIEEHRGLDGFALSAAIGHATCPPAQSLPEAIRDADSLMYRRKSYARGGSAVAEKRALESDDVVLSGVPKAVAGSVAPASNTST
jgi:diguanylate cyclase (GGDEF)-like protein